MSSVKRYPSYPTTPPQHMQLHGVHLVWLASRSAWNDVKRIESFEIKKDISTTPQSCFEIRIDCYELLGPRRNSHKDLQIDREFSVCNGFCKYMQILLLPSGFPIFCPTGMVPPIQNWNTLSPATVLEAAALRWPTLQWSIAPPVSRALSLGHEETMPICIQMQPRGVFQAITCRCNHKNLD